MNIESKLSIILKIESSAFAYYEKRHVPYNDRDLD